MEFIIENWYYFIIGLVILIAFIFILTSKPKKVATPEKVEQAKETPKEIVPEVVVQKEVEKEETIVEPQVVKEEPKEEIVLEPQTITEENTVEKEKPVTEELKKTPVKNPKYHVSQNKDEKSPNFKKWRVRKEGSEKTIKFFDTQKDAIAFAEGLANAAGSSVVIHKVDGSIRKQDYTKQ
ncbi:MAG: DUF2188 domain-containing protein [Candidatus Izemoplasmatales bacterium]